LGRGNIFLHSHKNGAPDTSSAISGGENKNDTSQVTVINNLFFDCDQAATAKEGNFFTLINNTIVRMTKEGGLDTADGAVCVQDLDPRPTTFGEGFYLEGNIIVDVKQLVRNYSPKEGTSPSPTTSSQWPGTARAAQRVIDPKLKHIPSLAETRFTKLGQRANPSRMVQPATRFTRARQKDPADTTWAALRRWAR